MKSTINDLDTKKKDDSRQVRRSQEDQKKQHLRIRGGPSIKKEK